MKHSNLTLSLGSIELVHILYARYTRTYIQLSLQHSIKLTAYIYIQLYKGYIDSPVQGQHKQ